MLRIDNCCLAVVDIQGKLARLMHQKEKLFANIQILIKAADILNIPTLWTQQVPESLGPTVPEIAELLDAVEPINKATFSCCGNETFNIEIKKLNRKQIILCGIEAHICIYQTALDLRQAGFDVTVIADAVSSRSQFNKNFALDKMKSLGINISTTEMALFEMLKTAEHPSFRRIAKLIK